MTKPDFIVIGAMKCATSTVCAYLEDHPEVFMVAGGEPRFFSHDEFFARGTGWYEGLFAARTTERICGEGSNDYAAGQLYPEAAARMAAFCPDLRLIYMVRHPLDRIASAWVEDRVNQGDNIPASVDQAVTRMPARYIDQSLYWKNLSRYRSLFDDSQIFIGFMEDLTTDRAAFFARLAGFLGITPGIGIRRGHVNSSQGKRVPSAGYTAVNRLPFSATLKRLVPKALRQGVKDRLLSRPVDEKPKLSAEVKARIVPQLREDARQFLAHCGKDETYWSWS